MRTLVLFVSVLIVALFAFLTVSVLIDSGPTVIGVISVVLLVVLAIGVLGALTSAEDDD
jgi:hypothetical protein